MIVYCLILLVFSPDMIQREAENITRYFPGEALRLNSYFFGMTCLRSYLFAADVCLTTKYFRKLFLYTQSSLVARSLESGAL